MTVGAHVPHSLPAVRHAGVMKLRALVIAATLTLSLAACSKEAEKTGPKVGDQDSISQVSPLTGTALERGAPDNPVFVVKIDNTRASAPQTGIDKADLVVEQTVEGGTTRLAVLYWTNLPAEVGHVRSMRATDIGIAKPVNGQLAASGGAAVTITRIRNADLKIHSQDSGSTGFRRGPGHAPYNVLLDLKALAGTAHGDGPQRPYFDWASAAHATASAPSETPGATPSTSAPEPKKASAVDVRFSGQHTTRWAFANGVWKRTNGTSQPEFGAQNLIVIHAPQRDAGYRDPAGNPVPETYFAGSGKFELFAGNTVTTGTWTKADVSSTITLKDENGQELKMPAGKTWIELVNDGIARTTIK